MSKLRASPKEEQLQAPRIVLFLGIIAILAPHIFYIELSYQIDANYTNISLVALLWILNHASGIDFTGPHNITYFFLPNVDTFLLSTLALALNICLVLMFWRSSKQAAIGSFDLRKVGIILAVQTIIMVGIVSYALDAWLLSLTFPFPLLHLFIVLIVLHYRRE